MPEDYIPDTDADFDTWQNQFSTYLNANLANLGLTALDPDVTAFNAERGSWQVDYPAHIAAQSAASAAAQTKDARRLSFEIVIRRLTARLQISTSVNDAERAALRITIRDTIPTPAPVPTTRPVGILDTSERFRQTMSFADEGTPTSRAKPAGVLGAELRVFVGATPPADPEDFDFAALDTRTPYLFEFDPAQAGQMAHWVMRWVNTRNQPGPWSDVVSAVVPG